MARVKRPGRKRSPPGRLRIVAGKWRSRLLPVIDEPGLRPTSERIRETLFNWLAPLIEGAHCLDLFAGTGALGIEAISRGADHVVFVEKSATLVEGIENILGALAATNAEVYQADALEFLRSADSRQFDIVFLDPPFATDLLFDLCGLLHRNGWLAANALVYLEQGKGRPRPTLPDAWIITHEKVAGKVSYSLVNTRTSN